MAHFPSEFLHQALLSFMEHQEEKFLTLPLAVILYEGGPLVWDAPQIRYLNQWWLLSEQGGFAVDGLGQPIPLREDGLLPDLLLAPGLPPGESKRILDIYMAAEDDDFGSVLVVVDDLGANLWFPSTDQVWRQWAVAPITAAEYQAQYEFQATYPFGKGWSPAP